MTAAVCPIKTKSARKRDTIAQYFWASDLGKLNFRKQEASRAFYILGFYFVKVKAFETCRKLMFQHILLPINTQAKALLSGASLQMGRDKPEARMPVFGYAE